MLTAWKFMRLDRNGSLEDMTQEVESVHVKTLCSHLREEAAAAADDDDVTMLLDVRPYGLLEFYAFTFIFPKFYAMFCFSILLFHCHFCKLLYFW